MEWDQRIFRRLWKGGLKLMAGKPAAPPADPGTDLPALECFARLVSGRPVMLRATDGPGGRRGDKFLMPFHQPLFDSRALNLDFFRLRILIMAALETNRGTNGEAPHALPLRRVLREYPGARKLYRRVAKAIRRAEIRDAKLPPRKRRDLRGRLKGMSYPEAPEQKPETMPRGGEAGEQEIKSEIEIELPESAQLIEEDKDKSDEYTLAHSFEKIETLDDFQGHWRDLENEDDLEEFDDALRELQFQHRIRTDEQAHSVVQADTSPGIVGDAADAGHRAGALYFDEWDYRRRRYRLKHCRVFESALVDTRAGYAARVLETRRASYHELERRLQRAYQELETVRRRTSGEEPDLDAVVQAFADLRAGRTPDERLYCSRRKRRKDIELSFLLDLSLSTDAWVAGRRALDIARESLIIFCQALDYHGIQFEINGFYSRTRNDCEFVVLKDARETWLAARDRLGALAPRGYTRMGPALRRGTGRLARSDSARRWMILFTDGRPSDYDRYEGEYGTQDVRQAIREAEVRGIHTHAFTIDARSRPAFRDLLGDGAFEILKDPDGLPAALGNFFTRLLAR